jgi:hypothetical protein
MLKAEQNTKNIDFFGNEAKNKTKKRKNDK